MNLAAVPPTPPPALATRCHVNQGECRVSGDPAVVFTTVLGSCVSACLYDPVMRIGGMNHILLAHGEKEEGDPRLLQRFGIHAMEVLINGMIKQGAERSRLKARLFGGASMHAALRDIGAENSEFARSFLRTEGIILIAESLGGTLARRVDFQPAAGRVRCRMVIGQAEPPLVFRSPDRSGQVELF